MVTSTPTAKEIKMGSKAQPKEEETEQSPTTLTRAATSADTGADTRATGLGREKKEAKKLTPEEEDKIASLFMEGHSENEISMIIKRAKSTVRGVLKKRKLLEHDPLTLKTEIYDLRMKMAQEDQETRNRFDGLEVEVENLGQSINKTLEEIKAALVQPPQSPPQPPQLQPPSSEHPEIQFPPQNPPQSPTISPMILDSNIVEMEVAAFQDRKLKLPADVFMYFHFFKSIGGPTDLGIFLRTCVVDFAQARGFKFGIIQEVEEAPAA